MVFSRLRKKVRLHHLGHVLDLDDGAFLFAVFADQLALGAVDPQRDLGAVVGEHFQAWQARPEQDNRERRHPGGNQHQGDGDQGRVKPPTGSHLGRGCDIGLVQAALPHSGSIYRLIISAVAVSIP
jgi:hypothetical protein